MGRESATFRDKETEIPSLSRDKGTMEQNLDTGRNRSGQPIKIRNGWDGTITIFQSKSEMGRRTGQSLFLPHYFLFLNVLSCFRTSFPVLERPNLIYKTLENRQYRSPLLHRCNLTKHGF